MLLAVGGEESGVSRRPRVGHFQEWIQGWCSHCPERQGGGDSRYFFLSMYAKQVY